jgi:hypothetical protein
MNFDEENEDTNAEWTDENSIVAGEATGEDAGLDISDDDIRQEVLDLKNQVGDKYWLLAKDLKTVYDKDLFRNWGFESWKQYVDSELAFELRKAQYLVQIHTWISQMPPAIQEWMHELGWTKCRMLLHVVTTENATEWKNRVEGKTVAEISEILKGGGDGGGGGEGGNSGEGDSMIEPSKKYTFGMKGNQISIVDMAIARAQELAETDKPSNALALICTEFLSNSGTTLSLKDYIASAEKYLGLKIVAMKPVKDGEDDIVYGWQYLDDKSEKPDADEPAKVSE